MIRRPELSYEALAEIDEERKALPAGVIEQVNINIKYDGYIKRQQRQVEQFKKLENKKIPEEINYHEIQSLRIEAKQKLNAIRPASIGRVFPVFLLRMYRCFLYISEERTENKEISE